MKRFAIIGLGSFGLRMLEELLKLTDNITIIDQNKDLIEKHKNKTHAAYVLEEISETALRKFLPSNIDTVIVDFSEKIELSIIITTFLKSINIKTIIVKAKSDEHGQILTKLGASQVIFPDREAAKRTTPILASQLLFKYMPISQNLSLAEVAVSPKYIGKSLAEANLRLESGVNVVGMRKTDSDNFVFMDNPDYRFAEDDVLLIVASDEHISQFSDDRNIFQKAVNPSAFKNLFAKN